MPPNRRCQIEALVIHRSRGARLCLSLAVALSTMQMTVLFLVPFHHNFEREYPTRGRRTSLLPPISQKDFRFDEYFRVPYAAQALIHFTNL
ncbi:hypothetical protein TNCV_1207791 [Trichonephila clavipes]|nr:hypothetical protein TNCV_1207791 [Trichonephila clavipes]